jgi:hypothetical protein
MLPVFFYFISEFISQISVISQTSVINLKFRSYIVGFGQISQIPVISSKFTSTSNINFLYQPPPHNSSYAFQTSTGQETLWQLIVSFLRKASAFRGCANVGVCHMTWQFLVVVLFLQSESAFLMTYLNGLSHILILL